MEKSSGRLTGRPWRNFQMDALALVAGTVVFATGLLLLARFHVAGGAFRESEFGVSRLVWVNVHRFGAVALVAAVAFHVQAHWRAVVARTERAWKRLPGAARRSDLILYAGSGPVAATALIAWFVAPGSPAVAGPVEVALLAPARHVWIDLHHLSGLIVLPAVVLHVRRHLGWMYSASGMGR